VEDEADTISLLLSTLNADDGDCREKILRHRHSEFLQQKRA
jgi:hypothetical protein